MMVGNLLELVEACGGDWTWWQSSMVIRDGPLTIIG